MSHSKNFRKLVSNKFKFGFFLLKELPSAFFSGVRVKEITEEKAIVSIPYTFFTKNPFRSVYFASQAMAAELSTGVLALSYIRGIQPRISMLVLSMKANFLKKTSSRITFECNEGLQLKAAVAECIKTQEAAVIEVRSFGKNNKGEIVSEFAFTWTFKQKQT